MKRIFCLALAALLVFIADSSILAEQGIKAFLDGKEIIFDQPPVIEDGRTLVPARAIMEAIGLTLSFEESTGTIKGTADDTAIVMKINDTAAQVNGKTVALDVPPKIIGGRTMVPLRFLGDALGLDVKWNPETKEIHLTSSSIKTPQFIGFFSDEEEIAEYLTEKFPFITLSGNKYSFEYKVDFNTSSDGAYDYRIHLEYKKNLMNHFYSGSAEQKQSETQELKNFMNLIAEDLIKIAPDKKFTGEYYYYESITVLSAVNYVDYEWTNYGDLPLYTRYDKTKPSNIITWRDSNYSEHLFEH